MIINNNPGAAMAARVLGESSSALQKSLARLSSGSKIASPADDAAGTGVAMKFGAQINRIQAAKDNLGNAISYSQTQDGFLQKIGNALDRMSELSMLAQDETKTDADRALYDKEFQKLDDFVTAIKAKDFNGISLFSRNNRFAVTTSDSGTTMGGAGVTLTGGYWTSVASSDVTSSANASTALTNVKAAISMLAGSRADVGANMSRYEAESSASICSKR